MFAGFAVGANAQVGVGQAVPPQGVAIHSADAHEVPPVPVLPGETTDLRIAPQLFIEHVNDAEQALATEDGELAKSHMKAAAVIMERLKSSIEEGQSDRFALSNAPATVSSQEGEAGSKAYLTLDLTGNRAAFDLQKAALLADGKRYEDAGAVLSGLINAAVVQSPAPAR